MTIQIETDGEAFILTFPAARANRSRTMRVPCTEWALLRSILIRHQREPEATIGTAASPTQAMVEAWLKAHGPDSEKARAARVKKLEQELGFSLEGIEL